MKTKKVELKVDFIGGQSSLTVAEEKAHSDFFRQRKWTAKTFLIQPVRSKKEPKIKVKSLRQKKQWARQ